MSESSCMYIYRSYGRRKLTIDGRRTRHTLARPWSMRTTDAVFPASEQGSWEREVAPRGHRDIDGLQFAAALVASR